MAVGRSVLLSFLLIGVPGVAVAQDTTTVQPIKDSLTAGPLDRPTAPDSAHRTTPMKAMFRSFLFPGWGQAVNGRKVTAGVMMGFEGLSVGMLLKIKSDERYIEDTDSHRLKDKRQQEQDWFALLIFNHLMSGLEAYVSTHLYDFPGDLQFRAFPGGRFGVGGSIPLGPR